VGLGATNYRRSTMRRALLAVLFVAGCSGTDSLPGFGGDSTASFCKAARKLPDAAADFESASVDDPAEFEASLRAAVDEYLAALDNVAAKAPAQVEQDVSVLRSAVDQYKFADAMEAKEPLDIYIAEHCPPSTTTVN
jgi:hypothetical protein